MINFNLGGEQGKDIKMSLCQRKAKTNLYKKEEASSRIYNKETEIVSSSIQSVVLSFCKLWNSYVYYITNQIITL